MSLLAVSQVSKYYFAYEGIFKKSRAFFPAVDQISLALNKGESLGLVGQSGSGKTTLANIFANVTAPDSGALLYKGEPVMRGTSFYKAYRRNVQMVFQHPDESLNPKLKVFSVLYDLLSCRLCGRAEIKREAARLMEMTGLSSAHLDRYPSELSGGQKQRISIARALALHPEVIIADEPVSSLDVSVQAQIINLLSDLKKNPGITFIFISHDLTAVSQLCEKTAVIHHGRVVEYGNTSDIIVNPVQEYTKTLVKEASA